jgi:hypothetical protein
VRSGRLQRNAELPSFAKDVFYHPLHFRWYFSRPPLAAGIQDGAEKHWNRLKLYAEPLRYTTNLTPC